MDRNIQFFCTNAGEEKYFKINKRVPPIDQRDLQLNAVLSETRLGDLLDFGQLFKAFVICPNLTHS